MFWDEFIKDLGSFVAILVVLFALVGMAALGYFCYREGVKSRQRLEKRSGSYDVVEAQREKERTELKDMEKRRNEIGNFL